MEKRRKKRFARRVQVRYWPKGDEHARKGYTTNLSTTGVFIATNGPLPPGRRLRIEFLGDNSFVVEAVVTHAARVATALQSIRSSGMGVRFLEISELIQQLLPPGGRYETEAMEETGRAGASESVSADGERRFERREAPRKKTAKDSESVQPATYTVGFRNVAYLLEAMEKEIAFGGVFVATDSPAPLQRDVRVALALPAPIKRTVHAEAVVVTVSDGAAGSEPAAKGMGVAFKEAPKVLAELERLIARARPRREDE